MSLPGFVGAFAAVALSSLSAETAEPFMAGFLFLLGVYVIVRVSLRRGVEASWIGARKLPGYALTPLGGFAGFMDAAGEAAGGRSARRPCSAPGAGAAQGRGLGRLGRIEMARVAALPAGGVIATPPAAWIVRKLPPRILGSAAAGVILITNAKTIVGAAGPAESAAVVAYVAIVLISLVLLARPVVALRVQPSQ